MDLPEAENLLFGLLGLIIGELDGVRLRGEERLVDVHLRVDMD